MRPRPYYCDFASHALREWAKGYKPTTEARALNRQAVIRAVKALGETECSLLCDIYASHLPIKNAVPQIAFRYSWNENDVWDLLRRTEKRVAKEAGIL